VKSAGKKAIEYPYCQLLAFYRSRDQGVASDALPYLEAAIAESEKSGAVIQQALFLEAAFNSVLLLDRVANARIWRDRARALRKPESLDSVDAVIAMGETRWADAMKHFEKARAYVARKRLASGTALLCLEKWAEYEAGCRSELERAPVN
jgi:hypothetical protein